MCIRYILAVVTVVLLQASLLAQRAPLATTPATAGQRSSATQPQAQAQPPAAGNSTAGAPSLPGLPAGLSAEQIRALQQQLGTAQKDQSDNSDKQTQDKDTSTEKQQEPPPARTEEPNAFQKFVQESTGTLLPVFGADLFSQVPSTFAPLDHVPVPADYAVGPGDQLVIRVWGQVEMDENLMVDRNGNIYVPKVGTLMVAGLKYDQLAGFLRSAMGRVFRNFDLNVNLGQLRSIQVFVVGKAVRPGSYTVSSLSTLVNALFASGGVSNTGSMRRIQLKRDGKLVTEFDFYDLLLNGEKSNDRVLLPGDVIVIPPVGPLVAVSGSVNTPAIYELKQPSSVSAVLELAGGLSAVADGGVITVERIDDHSKRTVDQFSLKDTTDTKLLKDGDLVTVLPLSPKFNNAVTLRGHVAVPGRYPWHEGMRVRDLVPTRDILIPRAFWTRQNRAAASWNQEQLAVQSVANPHTIRAFDEINWDYALIQRLSPTDLTVQLVPFDLGKCIDGDDAQNLLLHAGDTITVFSKEDVHPSIAQQERLVRLEGEVAAAGWYRVQPGETLRHLVERVGGFTRQAYIYGSEFNRESVRADQQDRLEEMATDMEREAQRKSVAQASNLMSAEDTLALKAESENNRLLVDRFKKLKATGRIVLNLSPSAKTPEDLPDIVLENGDRFYVPYRLSSVNVLGEVANPGALLFQPGKAVRDYLREVGGPSRYADAGRMFILHADGSVDPRQSRRNFWSRSFDAQTLMPGDTVVVPEQLSKTSLGKTIRDWAQMFSQFGLAAAAINVLK